MDLQQILTMFLRSNPSWSKKLEAITGQPTDHSIKCFNSFLEELNKGPGLKKPENKAATFNANYQLVLGLGCFKDYEAQILAADMSGFTLAEVVQHFRLNMHWDTNIDEIQKLYDELLPRFKEIGKKCGIFKDEPQDESGIPMVGNHNVDKSGEMQNPPWKNSSSISNPHNRERIINPITNNK